MLHPFSGKTLTGVNISNGVTEMHIDTNATRISTGNVVDTIISKIRDIIRKS